ncbi:hypothetical protein C8J27_110104 [Rhodobacter aestuarii]|uniref:Uncharacterized protein n=1 Tax=Rhodobacter aestuarii TaxID=453582 RepID=A0A1N7Q2G2_9RHOB|nr:hypothetical protein [Rhodobacter aestuarii]PTV94053.1 hypothetical protein C8J27_110104 [Rhodobacter aestuarii]SIT17032.1 hypothetical protein SAMN05421580_112104 [Rhodobacter aestuarii]
MMVRHFHSGPRPTIKRHAAAVALAKRLESEPASALVSAFLAATLGDVRVSGDRFEARAYGFRATSVRNRAQAVRNWMVAVTAEAKAASIGRVA